jgi:hypothetical protein
VAKRYKILGYDHSNELCGTCNVTYSVCFVDCETGDMLFNHQLQILLSDIASGQAHIQQTKIGMFVVYEDNYLTREEILKLYNEKFGTEYKQA